MTGWTIWDDLLEIVPVEVGRAKQCAGPLMVKSPPGLHIARNVRIECLPFRRNPVDDCALHPFCVVSSGSVGAFLNLRIGFVSRRKLMFY